MFHLFFVPWIALAQTPPSLHDAEKFFSSGNIEKAKEIYGQLISNKATNPSDLAQSECRMGIINSMSNDMNKSMEYLEKSISTNAMTKEKIDICRYALLQVYAVSQNHGKAIALYRKMSTNTLGTTYKQRATAIAVLSSQQVKDQKTELSSLEELKNSMDKDLINKVEISILNKTLTKVEIEKRLKELRNPDIPESNLQIQNSFQPSINDDLEFSWAHMNWQDALKNRNDNQNSGPIKVGIILPVHQTLTKFNSKILRGFSSYLSSDIHKNKPIEVIVGSAKSDPGSLEIEAIRLVLEKNVSVLVGPFTGTHAASLAAVSKTFQIPVIALGAVANTSELKNSSFVRMGILARSQSKTLTQFIKERFKKINSIGIFGPSDSYGLEMAMEFEKSAIESGLKVIRKDWFETNQTSFHESIQEIVNSSKLKNIPIEYRQNLKDAKQKALEEKRKFDPNKIKIPTFLEFQAVFVPESLPKVRLISTTFAFFDVKNILFVGDKQWYEGSGNVTYADDFLMGSPVASLIPGPYYSYLFSDLESSSQNSSLDLERQAFDSFVYISSAIAKLKKNSKNLMEPWINSDFIAEGTAKYGPLDGSGAPAADFQGLSFKQGKFSVEFQAPNWYE